MGMGIPAGYMDCGVMVLQEIWVWLVHVEYILGRLLVH